MGVKAKSPVSLLQEVYVRRGMTPQYDLVQVEGEVHQPTFKYRVTVGRTLATGCGHSKKKAKHCAAKIMLDKLKHLERPADSSCSQPPIPELSSEVLSPYEDCVEGNPVGSLQELCGARRWPPPVYLLTQGEEGAAVFTLDCVIKVSEYLFHIVHSTTTNVTLLFPSRPFKARSQRLGQGTVRRWPSGRPPIR